MAESSPSIGVLDLQGGVQEHIEHLDAVGVNGCTVKEPGDFCGLDGLIIPGGESTCLARLLRIFHLEEPLLHYYRKGMKLWGTCAGAILLAKENVGEKPHLQLIDVSIRRNAFGSQLDSFNRTVSVPAVSDSPVPLTFIRAPQIERVGPNVTVLLQIDDYIAAAEDEQCLVTIFHPELTPSVAFHRHFAGKCGLETAATVQENNREEGSWTRQKWMQYGRIGRIQSVGRPHEPKSL